MNKTTLRRLLALTATTALAACGPDDAQQNHAAAPLLSQAALQPGWSMDDLAGVDPAFLGGQSAPLPRAVPMRAAYRGGYDYAPAFDYGPDPYDERYYADGPGADDYQWLALASALTGMLGSAPPDYAFGYGGVQPWAWETGDRYLRYAEPLDDGYRYYYYEPDSYTPFLVSDPYYSYGYRNDRLVAIYDRSGRVIDARRAERQRQAAQDYYARARQMYLAAHREPRVGVPAPLWQRHRDDVVQERSQWDQARSQRQAWQRWDARNEDRLHRDWAGEALVRREAERSFAGWQKADFRPPAPRFYSQQQRQAQLRKVAEIRQQQPVAQQQTSGRQAISPRRLAAAEQVQRAQRRDTDALRTERQQQAEAQRQARQQQAQVERANTRRQVQAQREGLQEQARAQRANAQRQAPAQAAADQRQALAQKQAQQRQADSQRVKVPQAQRQAQAERARTQQARTQHAEAQAQRAKEQQAQAQRTKTQQQARQVDQDHQQAAAREARQRQQAAREQQLAARRAAQQQQAQARAAVQVQQQQARQAAQQKAAQARAAAQQEAAQAHAAAQQKAAQAHAAPQAKKPAQQAHGRGGPDRG